MATCINSHQHINEGDALIDAPDGWEGGLADASKLRVHCSMCNTTVGLSLCIETGQVGLHYKEHEVPD